MILCFGEVMGRLMPPGPLRLRQAIPGSLDLTFAGAESNAAAAIALLGGDSRYVTALPANSLGELCRDYFRGLGVDVSNCLFQSDSRLGLFFVENGVAQRSGQVLYDREHSAFAQTSLESYDWETAFAGVSWFFTTGISPAVSEQACAAALGSIRLARQRGVRIAFDPNHRRTLWRWSPHITTEVLAKQTFERYLPEVDLLITNPEQAADLLDIPAPKEVSTATCLALCRQILSRYPQLARIALTLRQLHSADDHSWGAALYDAAADCLWMAPWREGCYAPYRIRPIVDRLGTGDAFAAGLLYLFDSGGWNTPERALEFATANAALAHTILGDVNYISREDVELFLASGGSGRVVR